ncbi:LytR family transcriptional attenuator [Actinomycetospora succinea]|uniref:LytR family transcriptional attenuator n=1 Tax=Actinomycetospora succinea TaxID=663603 RepID=A0A4V3DA55_9PSEU|nr:LCP family protein [Actinomycetospora succinea]TDQ60658.1 LytR family transcriptional attenuator [Actinomycetospora succinea]
MPGRGRGGGGGRGGGRGGNGGVPAPPPGGPRQQPTRVGAPDWNRDPQVGFDPDVARAAREQGGPRQSWRDRMPERPAWSRTGGGGGGGRRGPLAHWSWPKRIGAVLAVIVLLFVGFGIYLDTQMTRVDALPEYEGSASSGTNWLIIGSDSRAGIDDAAAQQLSTGEVDGSRTDTMMLVHVGGFGGQTSLTSLPRDSILSIPGHGRGRLNSAYGIGGPKLLVQTIEQNADIEIDHYAEIGFEGFAGMVDAIGGVNMCLDEAIDDPKAGIDLPAGCQDLDGPNALGFVRTRAFPNADLQRIQNQRKFLSALISEASSPTVLLNPFRIVPFANSAIATLTVDDGTHVWNLASLGFAMRSLSGGSGVTSTVPIDLSTSVSGGVVWNKQKSAQYFDAIREDETIPQDLITGG